MRGQQAVSASLAGLFLGLTVAGCGAVRPVAATSAPLPVMAQSQASADVLAQHFADAFATDADFKVSRQGPIVTVHGPQDITLVYDFTRTPQTGTIQVQSGPYRTEVTAETGAQRNVYWIIAKVAIRMVYGGVKAYYTYTHNHTGSDYNKDDLVKAVIYGMLSQGVQGLPGGFLWKRLLPIVWEWIMHEPPITRTSIKQIYERWSQDLPKIEAILKEYQKQGGIITP